MCAERWTMPELVDRVAGALSSGYDGQPSGRVTDVPDSRAIRYYATLGLVDRPAEMRGRTAFYGRRHLWQLVAIKRLQADGRTLAEIQTELAGAPDSRLQRRAALPEGDFWRRVPQAAPLASAAHGSAAHGQPLTAPASAVHLSAAPASAAPGRHLIANADQNPDASAYQAVALDDGTLVLVPRRESLTDRDIASLRAAAGPLTAAIARLTKGQS